MPGQVAPWLEDLDEDWDPAPAPASAPEAAPQCLQSGSVKRDNKSPYSSQSRIPRRSSGALSFASSAIAADSVVQSGQKQREPLGELGSNAVNSSQLDCGPDVNRSQPPRSVSMTSAGSVVRYDTVERSKSSSPDKKNATLEWKKRLVNGEVGYGDQTDLFGPSGLENIFSSRPTTANTDQQPKHGLSRIRQCQHYIPPSSPPPWPTSSIGPGESPSPQRNASLSERNLAALDDDASSESELVEDLLADERSFVLKTSPYQLPRFDDRSLRPGLAVPSDANHPGNRTVSGQTDYSGEGFSPVYISKHTTEAGHVDYVTMDSRALRQPPTAEVNSSTPSRASAEGDDLDNSIVHPPTLVIQDENDETLPSVPEVSLPDNLPTGTPPIARIGGFVTTRRGGTSSLGSFKTRPLSPSQPETDLSQGQALIDEAGDRPQTNSTMGSPPMEQHRPITPEIQTNPPSLLSPPKTRPSPSPLKLFGNHDTFTSNKLLRRMSQLEDLDREELNNSYQNDDQSHAKLAREAALLTGDHSQQRVVSNLSNFGEGELDDHDFEAGLSIPSVFDVDAGDYDSEGSPDPETAPPGSRTPFRFRVEMSPDAHYDEFEQPSHLKRKLSKRSTARSRFSAESHWDGQEGLRQEPKMPDWLLEGKRPQSSPTKSPTPKRRRTLVTLNGDNPSVGFGSDIQVKITREVSDRRPQSFNRRLSSAINADLLRPRNPTPRQRRREDIQAEVGEATMAFLSSSPRLEAIKETLELSDIPELDADAEQAKAVAAEVAAFTLNVSRSEAEGKRNRSITTQDFLDEAMHIMSLIRARGRPCSALGSVEESHAEMDAEISYGQHLHPEDVRRTRSPSPLRLSRPPSRDGGGSGWRQRGQVQHDPGALNKLSKFQERDDSDILEASLRSLDISHQADSPLRADLAAAGLANVRINGPRPQPRRTRGESDASCTASGSPTKTHGSHPSLDSTSSRTIGTSSTRKSENVATLAPETVAHLIPEEVAGMTFDRDQQRWVRSKSRHRQSREREHERERESHHPSSNLTSEDDPFNEIPDLTVDEYAELARIRELQSSRDGQLPFHDAQGNRGTASDDAQASRPTTRDNPIPQPFTSSSAVSKYTAFTSSQGQPQIDTRATSWSSAELAKMASKQHAQHVNRALQNFAAANPENDITEMTEEEQATELTEDGQLTENLDEESLVLDGSVTEELPEPQQRQPIQQPWPQSSPGIYHQHGARQPSLRRQTLHRGLYANVQDPSEMSFIATLPDKRVMSVSVNLSQPQAKATQTSRELVVPSSSPHKADGTFYLSDLPDFTVHEQDPERPSEQALARRIAHHYGDRYALAVQGLVKTLQDAEPDEPYWEDVKQLDLKERNLASVHNLEDFCARIEDLDLSDNNLAHLEGAPVSLRRLNIRSNALSSLTAWGHLVNLQYLDISNNSIDSLAGLCMLVHLREVKADGNQISSLDGVMGLDGLLKLSVRENQLTAVDFEGCQLKRLEHLDLGANQLTDVTNIDALESLSRLGLDDNEIESFRVSTADSAQCSRLETISLQKNCLSTFDAAPYPRLRYLNVDENQLSTVSGLEDLRHLDTLSLRKQNLDSTDSPSLTLFSEHMHIRNLYLSCNNLPHLYLPHAYHSVQTLELASTGLQSLPPGFGLRFPNIRTLNLSFNALRDTRPLLNITRLHTLLLAGNRISRLRKTIAVAARMPHLRTLDLRENPVTLGFYSPFATAQGLVHTAPHPQTDTRASADPEDQLQALAARANHLPPADPATNIPHLARLDDDTKMRRRVYELLLSSGCKSLGNLDGLAFEREKAMAKDDVWERLVQLGVVRKSVAVHGVVGRQMEPVELWSGTVKVGKGKT